MKIDDAIHAVQGPKYQKVNIGFSTKKIPVTLRLENAFAVQIAAAECVSFF